jgi:hypothetical protein
MNIRNTKNKFTTAKKLLITNSKYNGGEIEDTSYPSTIKLEKWKVTDN